MANIPWLDTSDFPRRHPDDLRNVIVQAAMALPPRAGGDSAAPAVEGEPDPTVSFGSPKAALVDLSEKLSDGSFRYLKRKEAAYALRCGVDKVQTLIDEYDAGVRVGGTWYLDRTKLPFLR